MSNWEYCKIIVPSLQDNKKMGEPCVLYLYPESVETFKTDNANTVLAELGRNGWELISVVQEFNFLAQKTIPTDMVYVLKKPL